MLFFKVYFQTVLLKECYNNLNLSKNYLKIKSVLYSLGNKKTIIQTNSYSLIKQNLMCICL